MTESGSRCRPDEIGSSSRVFSASRLHVPAKRDTNRLDEELTRQEEIHRARARAPSELRSGPASGTGGALTLVKRLVAQAAAQDGGDVGGHFKL